MVYVVEMSFSLNTSSSGNNFVANIKNIANNNFCVDIYSNYDYEYTGKGSKMEIKGTINGTWENTEKSLTFLRRFIKEINSIYNIKIDTIYREYPEFKIIYVSKQQSKKGLYKNLLTCNNRLRSFSESDYFVLRSITKLPYNEPNPIYKPVPQTYNQYLEMLHQNEIIKGIEEISSVLKKSFPIEISLYITSYLYSAKNKLLLNKSVELLT
jgi:hypothetical protein